MNTLISILEYIDEDGKNPYAKWFAKLDSIAAAKISVALLRISQGNFCNVKWFKGIAEYRIDYGSGYRIYFGKEHETLVILLGGGTKSNQQADINKALELWQNYKNRKKKEWH